MLSEERIIVSLQATDSPVPDWIRLLPIGEVALADGRPPFLVDEDAMRAVLDSFLARGNDLVVDYEHQSMSGDKAPAAGWIKELKAAMDGLWARVEWTETARGHIAAKEYRYFSPVLQVEKQTRKVQDLLHAGLTNVPAIRHLPPLTAKAETDRAAVPDQDKKEAVMVEKFRQILGLADGAEETLVLQALEDWQGKLAVWQELGQALDMPEATPAQVKGAVLALKAGGDKLTVIETELTALRQERRQEKAAVAVKAAIQAGKVMPAQRDWALTYAGNDPEGFAAYVAVAPKVVPVTDPGEGKREAGGKLTADELKMCRAMGLDPELFKSTRQAERRAAEEVV